MTLNKNLLLFDRKSRDGPETYLVKDAGGSVKGGIWDKVMLTVELKRKC